MENNFTPEQKKALTKLGAKHFAAVLWNGMHHDVHGSWKQNHRQINVGVDVWDFAPVSHEKILKLIEAGPKLDGSTEDYGD